MSIKQISVFLENKSGRLAEVLNILGKETIEIHALTIADTSEYGILRLIVSDYNKAVLSLKNKQFTANLTDVIAISAPDKANAFAGILHILAQETIDIEYMYAFGINKKAIIIIRPESIDLTTHILNKHKIKILSAEDLSNI